jgi:hypothetical protein
VLSACGGGARQDANEPSGHFPVQVVRATFPTSQQLAQNTHLVITVRNPGNSTIPNVAVTIINPATGTAAQAFSTLLPPNPQLASRSRPVWIINKAPGPCLYSCRQGGPGGAVTAYSNTWALGELRPGGVARFDWAVTAVKSGTYTVQYRVAAGLNGKAKAVPARGLPLRGNFHVTIATKPRQAYVTNSGTIVYSK